MHHRGEYRIRGQKKTEDDFDEEIEEQLKLSTHAKGQKRQNSAVLSRKHHESSQNSRLAESRANSRIGSSVIGSRVGRVLRNSRTDKNGVVDIQFNNVRWISIVSAYDSKRLKNVTVSKQSCETFLKRYGTGIKNDAAAMALFKDIKRHFQSWLGRINEAFSDVIDDFLRVSERAPLQNFRKMEPILQSISKDTNMMGQKLEGCLKIYENNDFRRLYSRFQNFNQFSNKLEDLIKGIYDSKTRIDQLFSELQNVDDEIVVDRKVEKIIRKGVKEAEHIIDEVNGYNTSIRDRIISKVRLAINDMAQKSLSLFHKVQGAKDLIKRLHKLITDSRRTLESSEIRKISKIFKAVVQQANKFEDFVTHFNAQEDHISPKLRDKLNQYSESIQEQKRAVCEIQILFVQTVISQAIQTLKHNFTLNNALSPQQQKIQYSQFNHTLEEISDAMLNQSNRGCVEGLIKHGKSNFSKLDDELQKIKRTLRKNEGIIFIDTQNGEIQIMEYCNLADRYKTKIKNLINKHEQSLRSLGIFFRQARLSENERDPELAYLKDLRKVVEVVNSKQRIDNFTKLKAFSELNSNGNILNYGTEATDAYILMQQMNSNKKQVAGFTQNNPLKNLIKDVRFENNLYLESFYILTAYDTINKTTQKSIIENLTKLTQNNSKRLNELQSIDGYKTTKAYNYLLDRLYCLCLVKGLKKPTIKQLDDNKAIIFPQKQTDAKQMENQLKYRNLIGQTIGEGGSFSKNKIKSTIKVMRDMVSSYRIIQKLNNNANGQFIILVQTLSSYISQYLKIVISSEALDERGVQFKKIAIECIKSLKSKLSNIDLIDQQVDMETADAALKARNKILKIQSINQNALTSLQQLSKKNDYLQAFSGFIYTLTEYIQQSKQTAYIALNQFKQPIWLGSVERSKDGLIGEIDIKGYRRGNFIDQYVRQPPIVKKAVVQQPEKKVSSASPSPNKSPNTKQQKNFIVREKSHQKQSMDEEMAIESDKQMDEYIEDHEVLDDNVQEINDEMIEQFHEDIVDDDMEEQINQFQEDSSKISDKMNEDIHEEQIEEVSHSKPRVQQKATSKKEIKVEEPNKQKSSNTQISVYQIIPHFRELQQIREMFLLIDSTEPAFWSSQVDYQEVEDYYHRAEDTKDRNNFIKSMQSCFSMFINSRFQQGISDQIKRLERFISLKQKFTSFGQKDWTTLFNVLSLIDFSYSILVASKSHKDDIIQIKIAGKNATNFKKQGSKLLLENFLTRTFRSNFFKLQKFNLDDYLSYCFKTDIQQCLNSAGDGFHYTIKVIPQYKQALPESQTHSLLLSLEKIEEIFCTNLLTGIDFRALMIQLWVKAVCYDSEDYYKPDYTTLNKYQKTLDTVEKKEWIGHYLIDFRQSILKIRDKIKTHKNLIENTLFKIDLNNVWQCVKNFCDLYQKKITQSTVVISTNKQEKVVYAICEDSAIGVTSESRLSTFLEDLFNRSESKQQKNIITQQQIINFIGKQYQKDESTFELHGSITTLLNIMEIQHYYISQPQIIIKNDLEELVLTVLKNLNIKSKADIEYDEIFKDLFEHKKNGFTNNINLKKNIDKKIFTDIHIKKVMSRIKDLSKQQKENRQKLKNILLNNDMTLILFDYLANKSNNKIIEGITQYFNWLKSIEEEFNSQLTSKIYNLLIYVKEHKKDITNLQQIFAKNVIQTEPLTKFPKQSSNYLKIAGQISAMVKILGKWMIEKGFAKKLTLFSIVDEENSWTFGLEFNKIDTLQYLKQFLNKYLLTSNTEQRQNQKILTQLYKQYIEKKVVTKNVDNITEINLEISKVPSQLSHEIRKDLVQIEDMLAFTRYYNHHRFNTSPTVLKKLQEVHTKIISQMNSKLFLVQIKEFIQKCKWNGLEKINIFKELFQCFSSQLTYQKKYLSSLISQTQQIGVKETDLKSYIEWFKKCGVNQLKMQYYVLKSSQKSIISIFPVSKIQKDKSKSSEDIKKFLADIKLPPKYTIGLQNGISTINLQVETINCKLADTQNYLTEESQLQGFQPEIPEGQNLLVSFYQGTIQSQKTPLFIGQIKLETSCVLNIKQYETSSTVTCSIWKIAKHDYEQWKKTNINPDEQSYKLLRKKMRGLATGQQKIKDVCVGQDVNFNEIGAWLRQEVKKHRKRVEQKEKAEKQRIRLERLTIEQSQKFLATVYEKMVNQQSLPTIKVTLDDAKKFKSQNIEEPSGDVQGYWKKILDSNKKIIQKIEESKSHQQMARISTLTKDYLKILKIKLLSNQAIQENIVQAAKSEFSKVEEKREKQLELKRKETLEKTKRKKEEKEQKRRKRLAEQAAKLIQTNNPNNSLNTQALPQAKPAPIVSDPQGEVQSQQQPEPVKEQSQQIDECQLILECADFQKVKKGKEEELYMSYLIFLLESDSRKDADYYRCILKVFWKQAAKDREALVMLR